MMEIQSTETDDITLKNPALFRLKLRNPNSSNQIARFVSCYCYGVNVIKFSIRLKNTLGAESFAGRKFCERKNREIKGINFRE